MRARAASISDENTTILRRDQVWRLSSDPYFLVQLQPTGHSWNETVLQKFKNAARDGERLNRGPFSIQRPVRFTRLPRLEAQTAAVLFMSCLNQIV